MKHGLMTTAAAFVLLGGAALAQTTSGYQPPASPQPAAPQPAPGTTMPAMPAPGMSQTPLSEPGQSYPPPSYPPITAPQGAQSGTGVPMGMPTDEGMSGGTGARPGHEIGVGESLPRSSKSSNINGYDTHSTIAPTLPEPNVGPDANAGQLLAAANQALATHQTGMAEEAMERAETRILTRSVPQSMGDQASMNPVVQQIQQARQLLGAHDIAGAQQILNQILGSNAPALAR